MLYQHIIQVENKKVGLKVEGHKHTIAPPVKNVGGHMPPLPPRFLSSDIYIYIYIYIYIQQQLRNKVHTRNQLTNQPHKLDLF